MLQAIIHGKAARVSEEGNESKSWRSVFRTREDLLTAAFFGRLPYLSDDSIHFLIKKILAERLHPEELKLGRFLRIEYWPRLKSTDKKRTTVEPDLLIHFEHLILLVEVKPAHMSQELAQWEREVSAVKAFLKTDLKTRKPIHFLALGGIFHNWKVGAEYLQSKFRIAVSVCSWRQVVRYLSELDCLVKGSEHRVVLDQLKALELHGIPKPIKPFDDLKELSGAFECDLFTTWEALEVDYATEPDFGWDELTTIPKFNLEILRSWH